MIIWNNFSIHLINKIEILRDYVDIRLVKIRLVDKQIIYGVTIFATSVTDEFITVFSPYSVIYEINFFNADMQL